LRSLSHVISPYEGGSTPLSQSLAAGNVTSDEQ
jgi:hypothetical protein